MQSIIASNRLKYTSNRMQYASSMHVNRMQIILQCTNNMMQHVLGAYATQLDTGLHPYSTQQNMKKKTKNQQNIGRPCHSIGHRSSPLLYTADADKKNAFHYTYCVKNVSLFVSKLSSFCILILKRFPLNTKDRRPKFLFPLE